MTFLKPFLFGLLFASICGCTSFPISSSQDSWNGRFSVFSQIKGKTERHSGTFHFEAGRNESLLILSGPLGTRLATLEETARGAQLQTSEGIVRYPDSKSLMKAVIGVDLSFNDLEQWLRGEEIKKEALNDETWKLTVIKDPNGEIRKIVARRIADKNSQITVTLLPRREK